MQATRTKCYTGFYNPTQNERYVCCLYRKCYFLLNSGCQNAFGLNCSSNLVSVLGFGVEGDISLLVPAGTIHLVVPR